MWKCTFHLHNIDVFKGSLPHLGCQKERKTDEESDLDSHSVFGSNLDAFGTHFGRPNQCGESFGEPKTSENDVYLELGS